MSTLRVLPRWMPRLGGAKRQLTVHVALANRKLATASESLSDVGTKPVGSVEQRELLQVNGSAIDDWVTNEMTVDGNSENGEYEKLQRFYRMFDTQKIYAGLKYSGFTSDQADMLMLSLRDMVSRTLLGCSEQSVESGVAENEAYLFEAACSELRHEVQVARQSQAEAFRTSLAHLQRDVEILQHEVNEMTNGLKTELDIELNEYKNISRQEENGRDLQIQSVKDKITIDITSDGQSEIETFQWQTTRRALTALFIAASCFFFGLSTTYKQRVEKKEVHRDRVSGTEDKPVPLLLPGEVDHIVEERPVQSLR